jgi:hypothetical protein
MDRAKTRTFSREGQSILYQTGGRNITIRNNSTAVTFHRPRFCSPRYEFRPDNRNGIATGKITRYHQPVTDHVRTEHQAVQYVTHQRRLMQHTAPNRTKLATTYFIVTRKQVTVQGQQIPMCRGLQRQHPSDRLTPHRAQLVDIIMVESPQFTPEKAHTIRIE